MSQGNSTRSLRPREIFTSIFVALLAGQSRQQKPILGKRASKGHYCVSEGELPGVAELICWALLQVLPRGKAKKSATHPRHPLAGRSRRHAHPEVLGCVHTGTERYWEPHERLPGSSAVTTLRNCNHQTLWHTLSLLLFSKQAPSNFNTNGI